MFAEDDKVAKKEAIFTISDASYAVMALTMFESVSKHYPDSDLFLFIIGKGNIDKIDGEINVIYINTLFDEVDFNQRLAYYLQVELATSFRPHCFEHLYSKNYERAIYFDPDIYVFRRMTEVDRLLDRGANGVVTPHAIRASRSNIAIEGDETFLKCGIFNMGFMALNLTTETSRMIRWWKGKLKWQCEADYRKALFVDQKWMNLLPTYFEGFEILKSPLYNLAPWNSEHYSVINDLQGNFYLDSFDNQVAFIHFSGVKRSSYHFAYLTKARDFYLKELKKREFMKLKIINYEIFFKPKKLCMDKICIFLYKDYVRMTGDTTSDPLVDWGFYDYLLSKDQETNFPVYIRKLFDIFPDIFVGYINIKGKLDYDSVIKWMKTKFNYDGVVNLGTLIQLRNASDISGYISSTRFDLVDNRQQAAPVLNVNSSYNSAVLALIDTKSTHLNESSKIRKEINFYPDRIEIKQNHVKVCMPYFNGMICAADYIALINNNYSEIWVPNITLQQDLKDKLGIENVSVIPYPVQKPSNDIIDISLPKNKFIILIRHDFSVDFEQQGTLTSLKAFLHAFEKNNDVLLVCCAINVTKSPNFSKIRRAFRQTEKAKFVITNEHVYYSYLHYSHCVMSLHNSDPFGYYLAQALTLGKYVVATGSNGNYDYLNNDNSFLIESLSIKGRIENAALALTSIFSDVNILSAKGQTGLRFVQKHFSPNTIGFLMEVRLDELVKNTGNSIPQMALALQNPNSESRKYGHLHSALRRTVKKIPYSITLYKALKGLNRAKTNVIKTDNSSAASIQPAVSLEEENLNSLYESVMKILLKNIYRPDYLE